MARKVHPEGISHDPEDAPNFTHRTFKIYSSLMKHDLLAIQDDDRSHYPFLKQWVGMEVDLENQWSINNGTLGLDMRLNNDGKHNMEYCVRLKVVDAELILKTPMGVMGICNDQKRLIYIFKPFVLSELARFLKMKIATDKYVKHKHLYPKGWTIE